jgi:uncharacterized DUF497 family protein
MARDLPNFVGFNWDTGNRDKNKRKHEVTDGECEEIFFNTPLVILDDPKHSSTEQRFAAFGKSNAKRKLVVVFTMRAKLIRVISARDMSRREKEFYKSYEKASEIS